MCKGLQCFLLSVWPRVEAAPTAWMQRQKVGPSLFSPAFAECHVRLREISTEVYLFYQWWHLLFCFSSSLLFSGVLREKKVKKFSPFCFEQGSCHSIPVDGQVANPCVPLRWECYSRKGIKLMQKPLGELDHLEPLPALLASTAFCRTLLQGLLMDHRSQPVFKSASLDPQGKLNRKGRWGPAWTSVSIKNSHTCFLN